MKEAIVRLFNRKKSIPIDAAEFFQKSLKIIAWALPANLILLSIWYFHYHFEIKDKGCLSLLFLLMLNNFISALRLGKIWDGRFTRIYQQKGITYSTSKYVLWCSLTLSPIIGLYFFILLCRNGIDENTLNLKKHFLLALIVSIMAQGLTTMRLTPMLTGNFNYSLHHVGSVVFDASRIFRLKEKHKNSIENFMKDYRALRQTNALGYTGALLGLAAASSIIFANKNPRKNLEETLLKSIEVMKNFTEVEELGYKNALIVAYPYGIYLLLGNPELPIFMFVDSLCHTKQREMYFARMINLHKGTVKVLETKLQNKLEKEKYQLYKHELDELAIRIVKLQPH